MYINAFSIVVTMIIVAIGLYFGLSFVRKFALQIAQENHDAVLAMDQSDEEKRLRKERQADIAAATAYAQVEPLLTEAKSKEEQSAASSPKREASASVSP